MADGAPIAKNIVTARYVDGDRWGGNFVNLDLLKSDAVDNKATEAYLIYRRLFDFGKISQKDLSFGPVKSVGRHGGFRPEHQEQPRIRLTHAHLRGRPDLHHGRAAGLSEPERAGDVGKQ